MDHEVKERLERAGISVERPELLQVSIEFDANGTPVTLGEQVPVTDERWVTECVKLEPITQLLTTAEMTSFLIRPPLKHAAFMRLLQATAAIYCVSMNRPETDAEFDRLYRKLRRHPDSEDGNPLFSYLQGAARLYLSLRDVSRPEFESLTQRLGRHAQRACSHRGSTNYHQRVLFLAR